jgi:hypothetical protein
LRGRMNFDLSKGPEMLEKALGPKLGPWLAPPIWRLMVVVAVFVFFGAAIFGGIHGYATLKADFSGPSEKSSPPTSPVAPRSPSPSDSIPTSHQKDERPFSKSYFLSESDVRSLRDEVSGLRSSLPNHIAFKTADDPAARRVANAVAKGFGLGGISTDGMSVGYPVNVQEKGISIRVSPERTPDGALKAAEAIKKITGVAPRLTPYPGMDPSLFEIFVGTDTNEN